VAFCTDILREFLLFVVTFMVVKLEREREREREREVLGSGGVCFTPQDVVPDPNQGRKLLPQKVAHPISFFASIIITKQKDAAKLVAKEKQEEEVEQQQQQQQVLQYL
jgi:hypothetical protein